MLTHLQDANKQVLFSPSILGKVEVCLLPRCRDLQELKITVLICQMMQLYRRGWKKRTVTSDLKIDGKKEITVQKERLLTCKEKGIEEGFCHCCGFAALWCVFSAYFYFQISIPVLG